MSKPTPTNEMIRVMVSVCERSTTNSFRATAHKIAAPTNHTSRRRRREVWFVGAAILCAVALKLFVVDLSQTETITRIISFVGVGLLMLCVGYFSPLPPLPSKEVLHD